MAGKGWEKGDYDGILGRLKVFVVFRRLFFKF